MSDTRPTFLIFGGTGSFGDAFVRTLLAMPLAAGPRAIYVFSRDELKQVEMRRRYSTDPRLDFFIGDVRDAQRVRRACEAHVDVIIAAAAMKRIEACERNPWEAALTNIVGTQNIVNAAIDCGVPQVLGLSSDKACAPLGVYGASKLMMEKLITQGNNYAGGRTRLSCVRYGNVCGSRGSMIPIFADLARDGKPIRVTSDQATRFLLPLTDEGYDASNAQTWTAVRFVLWALSVMKGGEVFVPKLPAARVVDVARAVAPDSEIMLTGLGPFEKLHESMISPDEARGAVDLGPAYALLPAMHDWTVDVGVTGEALPDSFSYSSDQMIRTVDYRRAG